MANITLKTSHLDILMKLNATELKILLTMCHLAKNNHLEMNEENLAKISELTNLEKKTIRNNLTSLVKKEVIIKAGTLPNYVIDPAIFVTDNLKKAIKHFEGAKTTESNFRKNLGNETKKSRGNFEKKKLETELKNRRNNLDDTQLVEEAKKRCDV